MMLRLVLVSLLAATLISAAPYRTSNQIHSGKPKKDMFISRGWGAGGMPFSVLYMNPTYSSPKAHPSIAEKPRPPPKKQHKVVPQLRTAMASTRQRSRVPHSVIPQLFVSYGWGPLGK